MEAPLDIVAFLHSYYDSELARLEDLGKSTESCHESPDDGLPVPPVVFAAATARCAILALITNLLLVGAGARPVYCHEVPEFDSLTWLRDSGVDPVPLLPLEALRAHFLIKTRGDTECGAVCIYFGNERALTSARLLDAFDNIANESSFMRGRLLGYRTPRVIPVEKPTTPGASISDVGIYYFVTAPAARHMHARVPVFSYMAELDEDTEKLRALCLRDFGAYRHIVNRAAFAIQLLMDFTYSYTYA